MNKEKTIAVIGAGYWGQNLIRNFYNLGALKTICDNSTDVLNKFIKQYPEIVCTSDYYSVLNDHDIKGIVIALPSKAHYSFASKALESDKHVFVEKPLTTDINDAENLIKKAKSQNKVLMVGHLFQYHPVFKKLKEMTANNELGKIYYIYSNQLNLGKIRNEENILWSFAPHDISMILSLSRTEPTNVFAAGGDYLQNKIADISLTHFIFPNGIKAHIFLSWLHPYKERKLVVIGETKMAVFSDTEDWESKLLVYPHSIEWENNIPIPQKAKPEKIKIVESEPLENECQHFLECIHEHKKPVTDGEEGLRVLRVLARAQESMDTGA